MVLAHSSEAAVPLTGRQIYLRDILTCGTAPRLGIALLFWSPPPSRAWIPLRRSTSRLSKDAFAASEPAGRPRELSARSAPCMDQFCSLLKIEGQPHAFFRMRSYFAIQELNRSIRPCSYLWLRVNHCVVANLVPLLICLEPLQQASGVSEHGSQVLSRLLSNARVQNAHPGLSKVDAANQLPDNHDINPIDDFTLQG